jgi:BASS family bile acid:Na+ symporter
LNNAELVFTQLIPIVLFILMLGMGLSLTPQDFRRVLSYPRAAIIGLCGQLILLPLLAFVLALLFDAPPAIAVGAMLLAACPGGVTSNGYVFVARGDLGLSVTLTAITSVVTILTIPLISWFALNWFIEANEVPDLPALSIMRRLVILTAVPIAIGMLVRRFQPGAAMRAVELMRRISILLLIVVIIGATIGTWDAIVENVWSAGILAAALNVLSMLAGYYIARAFSLPPIQVRTITFEIGVQNLSLAVLVAVTILERPEFAILAVVYAFIMKITALTLIYIWRGSPQTSQQ